MIFRREVASLCETWHSHVNRCQICKHLRCRIGLWASPVPSQNLVGSTNGMDPTDLKSMVGSGHKIRVEIEDSVHDDLFLYSFLAPELKTDID